MKMNDFAQNLKSIRLQRGMSVRALADITGISPRTIYDWEAGKFLPKSFQAVIELSSALSCPTDAFYAPVEAKKNSQVICDLTKRVVKLENTVGKIMQQMNHLSLL